MIQITLSDLVAKVQTGWKKKALAEHYGLPVAQITKLLKDNGLTIRRIHAPKYELIDDVNVLQAETNVEEVGASALEIGAEEMPAGMPIVEGEREVVVPRVVTRGLDQISDTEASTTEW